MTRKEEAAPEVSIYDQTTTTRRMSNLGGLARRVHSNVVQVPPRSYYLLEWITITSSFRQSEQEAIGGKRRTSVTDELSSMMLKSLLKCLESHHINRLHISIGSVCYSATWGNKKTL